MGRLIDAYDLKYQMFGEGNQTEWTNEEIADAIDNQPTAYDVDKVVIEISDYFQSYIRNCNLTEEDALTILYMEEHVTKLVKGGSQGE